MKTQFKYLVTAQNYNEEKTQNKWKKAYLSVLFVVNNVTSPIFNNKLC